MTVTSRHPEAETEFGRGLIICLIKFAEHAEVWSRDKEMYSKLSEHSGFFDESQAVEMFFNGASDHLYGIEVPKAWEGTQIDRKVRQLQNFALTIGHGFTERKHTEADVKTAYDLCEEIALLIDRKIGLKPDIGQF